MYCPGSEALSEEVSPASTPWTTISVNPIATGAARTSLQNITLAPSRDTNTGGHIAAASDFHSQPQQLCRGYAPPDLSARALRSDPIDECEGDHKRRLSTYPLLARRPSGLERGLEGNRLARQRTPFLRRRRTISDRYRDRYWRGNPRTLRISANAGFA